MDEPRYFDPPPEEPAPDEPVTPSRPRRRLRLVPIAAAVGVGLLLVVPTLLNLGWAPLAHDVCAPGARILTASFYTPGVVGNSPYGGQVWANGTFPWNPTTIAGAGGNESNGGSFADLGSANFTIFPAVNQTVWGPGTESRCSTPYLVDVAPTTPIGLKLLSLMPEGTRDDTNAPIQLPASSVNDSASVVFGSRFLATNTEIVDTCQSSVPAQRWVNGTGITVGLPVSLLSGGVTIPTSLPVQTNFHYWFPAGFGIWLIDDLSLNGFLPGAGWAFEFHHCS